MGSSGMNCAMGAILVGPKLLFRHSETPPWKKFLAQGKSWKFFGDSKKSLKKAQTNMFKFVSGVG